MSASPQTLAQKLVARAAGRASVKPGEIVTCKVDLAMVHDSSGPRRLEPMLRKLGAHVWDPDKLVVITDHYLPEYDDDSRAILATARRWVKEAGVRNFHDAVGICHVVLPEKGHLRPGMFAVGGDSHSLTGGAFGAYMFGVGATEMLGVVVTGEIWLRVPETIRLEWTGRLADGVVAKDIMLALCGRLGMDGGRYQAVEYSGDTIAALSMRERMTLCNMAAELGAQTGLVAPDATTVAYLRDAGVPDEAIDLVTWQTDPGATIDELHRFDAAALAPQVAAPHSPANAAPADSYGKTPIDVAYIGACTGAKLDDLRMAARVLRGRKVARGTRLLVAPASAADLATAEREGTLAAITGAGAEILGTSCGACAGYGAHRFGDGVKVISSTARNFKGRMGAPTSEVFLGSPYSVAAAAVTGRIVDPRTLLAEAK